MLVLSSLVGASSRVSWCAKSMLADSHLPGPAGGGCEFLTGIVPELVAVHHGVGASVDAEEDDHAGNEEGGHGLGWF